MNLIHELADRSRNFERYNTICCVVSISFGPLYCSSWAASVFRPLKTCAELCIDC